MGFFAHTVIILLLVLVHLRLEKFRKEHPNEKLTPEIVEKIRTDIFF